MSYTVVTVSELRPGDLIMACGVARTELVSWGSAGFEVLGHPAAENGFVYFESREVGTTRVWPAHHSARHFMLVFRAPPPAVEVSSGWSSRCPRCQMGIYQGLVSFEHEGGACHG